MIDITEWMTAVGDSNSVYMPEFDRINEEADIESKSNEEPLPQEFALCDSTGFNVDDSYLVLGWNERTMRRDYPTDDARMKFNEHVKAREIDREVFVRKVVRNIGSDLIIHSLHNFDREAFNFRDPYKSLLKNLCLERNTVMMSGLIYKWINEDTELSDEEHDLQLKYHDVFNEIHKDMNYTKVASCCDSMYNMSSMSDVINDTIDMSDGRHDLQLNYHDFFNVYNENMIYVAVAVRCDSLSDVADFSCKTLVGHVTNSGETVVADYYMDSGRIGSLGNFKHDFQNLDVFLSPENGTVEWVNANFERQTRKKQRTRFSVLAAAAKRSPSVCTRRFSAH